MGGRSGGETGLAIAILAAGSSSRMRGGDKLLETVGGAPLLRRVVLRALACEAPVFVTLPPGGPRRRVLDALDVVRVDVPDAASGMSASFRAVGRVASGRPILCVLADMPEIEAADLKKLRDAHRGRPERVYRAASVDGVPGQPVLFPARLVARFGALDGDVGARSLLEGEDVALVRLADERALVDLDTPEAWDAWRARTGRAR